MCGSVELRNFAFVNNICGIWNKHLRLLGSVVLLYVCSSLDAQRRIVVVDMETGVPVRNVVVQYGKGSECVTIWDGSVLLDTLVDGFRDGKIIMRRSGYMTRTLVYEELTDTINLLPSFNALGEVVIYGKKREQQFQWSLPKSYGESRSMPLDPALRVNTDILGAIDKLLSYKRRKRLEKTKKRMAEY